MSKRRYTPSYYSSIYYSVGDKVVLTKNSQQETGCKNVVITRKEWDIKEREYKYEFYDEKTDTIWVIHDSNIEKLYEETLEDYDDSKLPKITEIV